MSRCQRVARPIALCLRPAYSTQVAVPAKSTTTARLLSHSASRHDVETTTTSSPADTQATHDLLNANVASADTGASAESRAELKARWLDPNTTTLAWAERKLLKQGRNPIGNRRRRAAVRQTPDIPFEQLPYHAFQEARKLLAADRAEQLEEIKQAHQRVKTVEATPAEKYRHGELRRGLKLYNLRKHVEYLKIQADINDPNVKRRFQDGQGDMKKPIYRFYAEKKWRSMAYKILKQRVDQFKIVPDVLPSFDPKMDVQLSFHGHQIEPGETVHSLVSETPPNVRVQVFDGQERLVSIVVMDSDVPNSESDSFGRKLHFMAANVPLDCLTKNISLNMLIAKHRRKVAAKWVPPVSQEGAPYHRISVWILEQPEAKLLSVSQLRQYYAQRRDGFSLQEFRARTKGARPIGFNMFRSEWDESTAKVMARHHIPGAEIVFRHKRVHSLKPPKKARGWEAKRQGPGHKHLWKYSKRIATMKGGR